MWNTTGCSRKKQTCCWRVRRSRPEERSPLAVLGWRGGTLDLHTIRLQVVPAHAGARIRLQTSKGKGKCLCVFTSRLAAQSIHRSSTIKFCLPPDDSTRASDGLIRLRLGGHGLHADLTRTPGAVAGGTREKAVGVPKAAKS